MKRSIILSLLVALTLTGCSSAADTAKQTKTTSVNQEQSISYPISFEVPDSLGNIYTQTFKESPTHVITNNQSSLELLLELGLEDNIIGTIALDNPVPEHLEEAFSKVEVITESKTEPAKEVIVGMSPDLVIGRAATFTDDKYGSIETLNSMNANVYTQLASTMNSNQSLDNIFLDIKNVGKIFNVEERADNLADELEKKLNSITEKIESAKQEPLKVMVMTAYKDGSYNVFGANAALQNEILKSIGGVNINEKGGSQSLENLINLNPDVILYVYNNKNIETDKAAVDLLNNNELIQSVSAIENDKVFEVSYTEFMGYGHRIIDCIEDISIKLYPELFK